MKVSKDGKTENITIKVEKDLKNKAEELRQQHFKRIPMNLFLEMMIEKGMEFEEFWRERENAALDEFVARKLDMSSYKEKGTGTNGR
jgi:hypothetical protein